MNKTDILSTTLTNVHLKTSVSRGFEAGGRTVIEFPGYEGIKFNVILRGECSLSIVGSRQKYHFKTGDCFLMTQGKPFSIGRDLSSKRKVNALTVLSKNSEGTASFNGGEDFLLTGALFTFEGPFAKVVLEKLPPVIHIPENLDQALVLRWGLERFHSEYLNQRPGRSVILNHLAPIMLLQIFRVYLQIEKKESNWITALEDANLMKVIESMHTDFGKNWSLESLAKLAGMSRSGFALKFKNQVGFSPLDYLTRYRMQIACELLEKREKKIAEISQIVGYESESAFSYAFNKIVGHRPGRHGSIFTPGR
ncbi:AraC family transcriptional regulator [Peredibacter starrii]|uniref:AraC family transcriptional regulator n=1 Tax=Peredibacter starrii TaxID=28202 RepID=A0AAX4HU86_9BACT|nr:AraC family transcriptional regulator [Peredibacter starrii]WPU66504.1 AraC family transcriptional regulator [Peredibacter starrii]